MRDESITQARDALNRRLHALTAHAGMNTAAHNAIVQSIRDRIQNLPNRAEKHRMATQMVDQIEQNLNDQRTIQREPGSFMPLALPHNPFQECLKCGDRSSPKHHAYPEICASDAHCRERQGGRQ